MACLTAHECVEQGGFASIGLADNGDIERALLRGSNR